MTPPVATVASTDGDQNRDQRSYYSQNQSNLAVVEALEGLDRRDIAF